MEGRILVVSDHYHPDDVSTGYFLTGIAEGLARHFPVRVLCGRPADPRLKGASPWRETRRAVAICRLPAWGTKDRGLLSRALRNLSFGIGVFLACLFALGRDERALVVTNPPLLPFFVAVACRLRGARFVLLIHDLYPDALAAAGLARHTSWLVRIWAAMNGWLYRDAERIVVLGRDVEERLTSRNVPTQNTVVIPNWADLEAVRPEPRAASALLGRLGIADRFVVQVSGNLGRTHDPETLLASAERLRDDPHVHFLLAGWGTRQAWLARMIGVAAPDTASVLERQPRKALSSLLNAADLHVIAYLPGMAGVSVPSRLYNMMAAGKPILAAADPSSELARVVREEDIGWVVPPGDPEALAAAIRDASADPAGLAERGRRARAAAEAKYGARTIAEAYLALFRALGEDATT